MLATIALLSASVVAQCPGGSCALPTYSAYRTVAPAYQPAPTLYRLADYTNQVWQHADPAVLSAHVARINAARTAPVYAPVYSVPCAGGACRR